MVIKYYFYYCNTSFFLIFIFYNYYIHNKYTFLVLYKIISTIKCLVFHPLPEEKKIKNKSKLFIKIVNVCKIIKMNKQ